MNMNTNNTHTAKRKPDPFDGSAPARLARMGVLLEDGSPDERTVALLVRIFAGSFLTSCGISTTAPGKSTRCSPLLRSWQSGRTPSGSSCSCLSNMTPCESLCRSPSGGWRGIWRC